MLESFRTHKRWLMFFLMVLVIPSFVVTGIYGYNQFMGDENALAKVGDIKISPQDFDNAKRERADRLRQSFGESFDPRMLDTAEARAAILDSLLIERALTREAAKENVNVSEAEVVAIIKSAAPFQREGQFDPALYQNFLAARGRSDQQFVNEVRQDLVRQQLVNAIGNTAIVPKSVAESLRTLLEETREVRELVIRPEEFLTKAVVADDAAQAFYDKNKASFETPEALKVEYVVLDPESASGQISAPDAEIKAYYEQNKARFGTEEQRRASHILLPIDGDKAAAKKTADELVAKLRANPAEFAKLAREFSKDPGSASNGGDLGFFGRNMMTKPFEDATFKLKQGEISDPIETDFGYHVIRVSEIKPAQVKPFEAVRGELEREYRAQQAQKKFAEGAEQFTNTVYEQSDSLKPVIEKFKLAAKTVDGVTRQGVANGPKELNARVIEALFADDSIRNKRNTQAIEVAPNTLVAARVVEHRPAALRPLDEVKAQIKQRLQAEEAVKLARAAGEARLADLQKSPSDAGFGPAASISRANPQGRPPVLVNAELRPAADKLPAYVGVEIPGGAYVIARVLSSKLAAADANAAVSQQRALAQAAGGADDLAYAEGLKARHKAVVLNPDYQVPAKAAVVKGEK
ncbi:MAG: SurA N-terminal domain-containing protein [Burkholderiaceae bacterium]